MVNLESVFRRKKILPPCTSWSVGRTDGYSGQKSNDRKTNLGSEAPPPARSDLRCCPPKVTTQFSPQRAVRITFQIFTMGKSATIGYAASALSEQDESERLSADLALFLSDPNLQSALADGSLDLSSYSSTINSELATLERECIALHRRAAPDIRVLREEMDACDSILAGLHEMLLGFQADLSGLSGDIRQLQDQSRSLAVQVDNRRDAEEGLRLFLERIVVPPNLAHVICRGEVDEIFLECVKDLEEKFAYVQMTENNLNDPDCSDPGLISSSGIPPASTVAGKEMVGHISKLRLQAVDRTRAYFLKVMKQLRRPKTHVRMIQSHALLKYEYLVDFLLVASPR
ncbi:hypothetical protein ACHAW5_008201 [Stephanodiscus triporus]|uniref:Vps52 coiled-coil domain-containing protein n=1 Tax=Stephanodiscus triporus TaxID=2934178 RepID=A0ABD3MQJ1_9STRA